MTLLLSSVSSVPSVVHMFWLFVVRSSYVARLSRILPFALLLIAARLGQAQDIPAALGTPARSPWETSLALELANDLSAARRVLVESYGPTPAVYAVSVRLAWLSYQMGDARQAIELYARSRLLPGALYEATVGLALAYTMEGYRQLDRGDLPSARMLWREALAADSLVPGARNGLQLVGAPEMAAPEIWVGSLSATSASAAAGSSSAQVIYASFPYRINDELSIRGAVRHVESSAPRASTTTIFASQDEAFAGVSLERGRGAVEAVGFILSNTVSTSSGLAVAGRAGGRYGATLMLSAISQTSGSNLQVAPQVFAWVYPFLAFNAGVRATQDPDLSAVSTLFGTTLRLDRIEFDLQSHIGSERLAVTMAGPTVLSFSANGRGGSTATASLVLDTQRRFTVFGQGQVESLLTTINGVKADGTYRSAAIGIRVIP